MVSMSDSISVFRPRRRGGVIALLRSALEALTAPRRVRGAALDMRSMSDHQLRDLGLHRSEIELRLFGTIPYYADRRDETR
jgi:uncharacterized protein YjiS (DUF1127 family)